jgi:hypothetical protein
MSRNKWIILGIFIIGLPTLLGLNYYSLANLQFSSRYIGEFDLVTLSSDVQMDVCNPGVTSVDIDKIIFDVNYKGTKFATLMLKGGTINPSQYSTLHGNLALNPKLRTGFVLQGIVNG